MGKVRNCSKWLGKIENGQGMVKKMSEYIYIYI